jgi:ATP-dependent DNA helicase RecG
VKEANLVEPFFKEEMGGFSVYLNKTVYDEKYFYEKGLNDRQVTVMMYVMKKGKVKVDEYSKIVPGISKRTLQRDLKLLISKGFLVKVGGSKNIHYEKCI